MLAGRLIAILTMGTGVVRRGERTDHELPRPDSLHRAADLLDDAAILVPHRGWLRNWVRAAVGPQVGPAHTSYRYPHDGICRFYDFRSGRSSKRTSPGA